MSAGVPNAASRIEVGTPTFRRVTLALTAAGFSTFTVLYCVQPFLPVLKDTFHDLRLISSGWLAWATSGSLSRD